MTDKLSRKPQNLRPGAWYYEEFGGIDVIYEIYMNGKFDRMGMIRIPWRKLRASLKRKDLTDVHS